MTRPPRLTIAALVTLVAYCGAALAALRTMSEYWASALVSATFLALLGSAVAALGGRHRAAWTGFAVFGWGYFLATFASPFRDVVRPHLLTTVAVVESYRHLHPEVRVEVTDLAYVPGAGVPASRTSRSSGGPQHLPAPQFVAIAGAGPRPIVTQPSGPGGSTMQFVPSGPNRFYTFEVSAHAAFTLAFAGLGGLFAALVAGRAALGPGADAAKTTRGHDSMGG